MAVLQIQAAPFFASKNRAFWNLQLAGWGAAYIGNRQLVEGATADLDKALKLQADRVDLASRLEAMNVLQDRIRQLEANALKKMKALFAA